MKLAKLLPFLLLAACTDNATKQESLQIFAASSAAMASAQSKAVDQARATNLVAPAELSLDFSGPCSLGGTVGLKGDYAGSDNDDHAAFDLDVKFNSCHELAGTLDGSLTWTSKLDGSGFKATLSGDLDWKDSNSSASCGFDMTLEVGEAGVHYDGHLCGYDVKTDLTIGH